MKVAATTRSFDLFELFYFRILSLFRWHVFIHLIYFRIFLNLISLHPLDLSIVSTKVFVRVKYISTEVGKNCEYKHKWNFKYKHKYKFKYKCNIEHSRGSHLKHIFTWPRCPWGLILEIDWFGLSHCLSVYVFRWNILRCE